MAQRNRELRAALDATARLDESYRGFVSEEDHLRNAGYSAAIANLTEVVLEVKRIAAEPKHTRSVLTGLGEIVQLLQSLSDGAIGLRRQQAEQRIEGLISELLAGLGLMRDGRSGEGCNLFGTIEVPRVSGSLRVVPAPHGDHRSSSVLPDFSVRHALYFNASHTLRHLSFGAYFPGMANPLDNVSKFAMDGAAEVRYMIKVVPSAYKALDGSVMRSNLFSVTENFRILHWHSGPIDLPGLFFFYDISPMLVEFTERRGADLLRTVARICALVGGVFTVSGILDGIVYHSSAMIQKQGLGKLS